jgi:hypothetical protein
MQYFLRSIRLKISISLSEVILFSKGMNTLQKLGSLIKDSSLNKVTLKLSSETYTVKGCHVKSLVL